MVTDENKFIFNISKLGITLIATTSFGTTIFMVNDDDSLRLVLGESVDRT